MIWKQLMQTLGPDNYDSGMMNLKLVPLSEVSKNKAEFYLVDTVNFEQVPTNVSISWDGSYGANQDIPFEFAFFNENGDLLNDVRYGYAVLDENEQELIQVFSRRHDYSWNCFYRRH